MSRILFWRITLSPSADGKTQCVLHIEVNAASTNVGRMEGSSIPKVEGILEGRHVQVEAILLQLQRRLPAQKSNHGNKVER